MRIKMAEDVGLFLFSFSSMGYIDIQRKFKDEMQFLLYICEWSNVIGFKKNFSSFTFRKPNNVLHLSYYAHSYKRKY